MNGHLPEECFEIFGKFSSTCITGIHGDEQTNGTIEANLFAHEQKACFLLTNGILMDIGNELVRTMCKRESLT